MSKTSLDHIYSVNLYKYLPISPTNNDSSQNNCFIKGSHKYDVYWRDKNKAHLDQIKTAFRFVFNAT